VARGLAAQHDFWRGRPGVDGEGEVKILKTSNIQSSQRATVIPIGCWALDIGCSMFQTL
jgi:hypothetical protein